MFRSFERPNRISNGFDTYIVQEGDSLWSIGQKYGISPEELMDANHLSTDAIYPNQVLFIPIIDIANNSSFYKTVDGDTLGKIFNKLKLNASCLKNYKPILGIEVMPDQVIELVDNRSFKRSNLVYQGENIKEFLSSNNLTAMELLELNKSSWFKPGSRIIIS